MNMGLDFNSLKRKGLEALEQKKVGLVNQAGQFVSTKLGDNINPAAFAAKAQEKSQEVTPAQSQDLGKSSVSTSGSNPEQVSNKPVMFSVPIEYHLTGAEVYLPAPKEGFFGVPIEQISAVRSAYNPYFYIVDTDEKTKYIKNTGQYGFYDDVNDPDYGFKYNLEDDQALKSFSENGKVFNLTPYENEDPLITSFEIRIKRESSPLFNGEAWSFLRRFSPGFNTEMRSRIPVLKEFLTQMPRFFSFDLPPIVPTWAQDEQSIFSTPNFTKKYYVKRVSGLDKLTESNLGSQLSSFVKYKSDMVTLTFQEDTSLSLGTLLALYKQLYWSRLHGKNLIPENVLRFDCEIIVSEVRNLTRIVKSQYQGKNVLQTLHDNVSRYVYDVYECQFFVDKLTHGDAIGLDAIKSPEDSNVSFTYKYSNMRFERFNFAESKYKRISDRYRDVLAIPSFESNSGQVSDSGIILSKTTTNKPIAHGIYGADSELTKSRSSSLITLDGVPPEVLDNTAGGAGRAGDVTGGLSINSTPAPTDSSSGVSNFNDLQTTSTPIAPETPAGSPDTGGGNFLDKLKSNQKISDFLNKSNVGTGGGSSTGSSNPSPTKELIGKINQQIFKKAGGDSTQNTNQPNGGQFKLVQDSISKINTSFLKDKLGTNVSNADQVTSNSKIKDAINKFGGDSLSSKLKF